MISKKIQGVKAMIEIVKEPLLALLAPLLLTGFVISHTYVPTESMMPTITPGNHVIVNRLPYYYRDPVRGEIVVFVFNDDYLIKRVIGTPGDTIHIIDDQIYVNGEKLDETAYMPEDMKTYIFAGSSVRFPYKVPEDCYFMMGDNRINSSDSRVFGAITRESIIAKAGLRIFPFDEMGWIE